MRISDWSSDVCSSDLGFPGDCSAFMAVAAAGPGEGWPGRLAKSHAVTLRWRTSTALAATLAARPAPRTAGSGSVAAYGNRQRRAPWGQQARGQPDLGQPDWGQPDCGQSGRAAGRPDGGLYAALDLGTNNCRLLVARPSHDGFRVVDAFSRIVRLGEGLAASGELSGPAMARTIEALKEIGRAHV